MLGSARSLERTILPAFSLADGFELTRARPDNFVLKHTDGFGGEQVFIGKDLPRRLRRISLRERHEWVVQQRTRLNTLDLQGILSRHRRLIADLGVFVQYDWAADRFQNFEVGGFITRATNTSYKVNVSGGGIQVPVMFAR